MRASIHYLSLLLFALPVLSARYHIVGALPQGDCIISTGKEKPGHPVKTGIYHEGCPPQSTILNVEPAIKRDSNTYGYVSGKSGLYIGRTKDGKHLEWVKEAYKWEFSPGAQRVYHVVRVPEKDEFWSDSGNLKPVSIIGPGVGDVYWTFEEVKG
ncbi:hypothetical protein APHAL10511_006916 [Amanita phalloides]|nr:hypothetical protein APHAL10511_006916 [Amanita phalloides]